MKHRDYETALRRVEAVEYLVSRHAETSFLRARICRKLGQMDHVRIWLERAAAEGCAPHRIKREECLAKAQSGQLRDVKSQLPFLLANPEGDEQEICEAYVLGAIRNRQWGMAMTILQNWIADFPQEVYPLLLRARLLVQSDQYVAAESDLRTATAIAPDCGEAQLELGQVLLHLRQAESARAPLVRASQHKKLRSDARIALAKVNRVQGKIQDAMSELQLVAGDDPENVTAMTELARLELDVGNAAGALPVIERAYQLQPTNVDTRYVLAQALQAIGRVSEAQDHLKYVNETNLGRLEIHRLTEEVLKHPQNSAIRRQLGELTLQFGDADDGVLWLLSALDIDPNDGATCRILAEHYAQRARTDPDFRSLAAEYAMRAAQK